MVDDAIPDGRSSRRAVPLPVDSNGLAYELVGDGTEPIVLVHGSWSDRRGWDPLLPVFSDAFRTLAYDRRGHGESAVLPGMRSVGWEADELGELLVSTDHFPAHVLGVSYGAAVALSLAVRRPELIRSVIVHEPPLMAWPPVENQPDVRAARAELDAFARRARQENHEDAAREFAEQFVTVRGGFEKWPEATREAFRVGARSWPDELGALERADLDPGLLGGVDLPVLVSHGEVGPPYLGKIARSVAEAMPNATLRSLPGAGHFPHVTHPALFGGTVLAFALERDVPVS
jgi:pimeloyl-ACP methyl ester carboxylesterase